MRQKTFLLVIVVGTLAAALYSVRSQTSPHDLRAFFVMSVMSSPTEGSPYPRVWNEGFAVRPDGSWVHVTFQPAIGSREVHVRDVYDVSRGLHTTVEELTESTVTRKMSPHEISVKKISAAVSCNGKSAPSMLSFDIEFTEETSQIEDADGGTINSTVKRWMAPALGCFDLKKETIFVRKRDGVRTVDTTHQAVSVTFQAVDDFFQIPSEYTERSPGEVLRERARLYPAFFPLASENTEAIDNAYRATQVPK